MSVHKLNIYNAVNAYSKQISLSRFVQKKNVAMALKSLVESAISEEGEQQPKETEETDED